MKTHIFEISGQKNLLPVFLFFMLLEMVFFSYYGISRHFNYLTSINDLGHMDQAVWGTLKGELFLNSDAFNKPISRLGIHFDPVLALFVPFYLLVPSVVWLILAQAVAIPLTGLPIFFLARRVCQSEKAAFFWAAACLFSPFMMSAASWDFHPVSLAAPFIALAYLAVDKKQAIVLFAACLFVLLCKEHFGLLVIGFGLLWYIRHRDWKTSLSLILLGLGFIIVVMKVIMPAFSPLGQHLMMSKDLGQLSRYGWLGHSLEEIVINILANPVDILRQVFIDMGGLAYLVLLLLPFLCLPLVGCEFLFPGIADLLVNLLSANPMPRRLFAYHSVTLIPVLIAAGIYGSRRAGRLLKMAASDRLSFIVFFITLVIGWLGFPFFSLPNSQGIWEPKRIFALHDPNYAVVRDLVTPDMSVSVQGNIGAHFTHRHEVYIYPNKVGEVDAVVLRLDNPTTVIGGRDPGRIASLAHHLQMDPLDYLYSIRDLLSHEEYPGLIWKDPWLILLKGKSTTRDVSSVMKKIAELELAWLKSDAALNDK
jgi:uncharacterized membrane protein